MNEQKLLHKHECLMTAVPKICAFIENRIIIASRNLEKAGDVDAVRKHQGAISELRNLLARIEECAPENKQAELLPLNEWRAE